MKIIVLLVSLAFTCSAFAKTVARVIEVKGNAFTFSEGKSTNTLRYGSKISDLSDVMVEDGSALSLINNLGHVYHISGGTLVKFYNGFAEVKNGQVWIEAKESTLPGIFHTSNSIAKFKQAQFIYSFDNMTGKTQLLVLTGDVAFSNALEPEVSVGVPAGYFSLVGQDFENSLPRAPTKVGLNSYKKFKTLFAEFDSLQDTKIENMLWNKPSRRASRSIASVNDQFVMGNKKPTGRMIKITTYRSEGRVPASVGPMSYYKKILNKEANLRKPASTGSSIQIKYYGFDWNKKSKSNPVYKPVQNVNRVPAQRVESVKVKPKLMVKPKVVKNNPLDNVNRKPASAGSQKLIRELSGTSVFEKSLINNTKNEKRHDEEVNSLIDDLKSYQQDYKKNY